jgi:hypothetical protein
MAGQKLTPPMWAYLLDLYCDKVGMLHTKGTRDALVRRGLVSDNYHYYNVRALTPAGLELVNKVLEIVP